MLKAIIKRSSNNHQAIIQLQMRIPELCSKKILIFWFDIHTNMCPNINNFFWKKIENCKCYKHLTKIINNYIIIIVIQQQKLKFRILLKTTSDFFIWYWQQYVSPHCQTSFFEKNYKCKCYKRSSSNHQTIIKRSSNYKCKFPNFVQNNSGFFIWYSQLYVSPL